MTAVIMIGVNLVVLIGMGIFFHRRIENRMKPDELVRQLREEVNGVIVELNQATDRNVSIIEDRLETINKTIARADRAVKVLQGEVERRAEGQRRYNELGRHAGILRSLSIDSPEESETPASLSDGAESSGGEVAEDSGTEARTDSGDGTSPDASSETLSPSGEAQARRTPQPGRATEQERAPSKKDRILDLHRKGIAANIIAGRVGSTVGEVELVISLSEGRE